MPFNFTKHFRLLAYSPHQAVQSIGSTPIWDDVLKTLSKDADPEAILIDASYVKLHQHGSGAKGGTSSSRSVAAKVV